MNQTEHIDPDTETPVVINCDGEELIGIVNFPENASLGVVFVAGGDQYRVGSHRIFVQLARALAEQGIASLRFDHRGVGDSPKPSGSSFEQLLPDIRAAIKTFSSKCPRVHRFCLAGLCDGASAILIAGHQIQGVGALVLLNPWVHNHDLEARVRLTTYYGSRLRSKNFWGKLFKGQLDLAASIGSLMNYMREFISARLKKPAELSEQNEIYYVERMCSGAQNFVGPILIVLSGQDLVAQQFKHLASSEKDWKDVLGRDDVEIVGANSADHTFTEINEKAALERIVSNWLTDIEAGVR